MKVSIEIIEKPKHEQVVIQCYNLTAEIDAVSRYIKAMDGSLSGYMVCSIDHPYHSFYTVNENQKVTLIDRAYIDEYANLSKYDKEKRLVIFQKWMDVRVGDINFVIDTIISTQGDLYQLVDSSKIGVFGHSLGGAAAAA